MQEVRLLGRKGVGNLLYLKRRSFRTHTLNNFFPSNWKCLSTTHYLIFTRQQHCFRQQTGYRARIVKNQKDQKCQMQKKEVPRNARERHSLCIFSLTWNVKKMYIIFKETPSIFWAVTELKRLSVNISVKNKGYCRIRREMNCEGQKREPLV